MMYSDFCIFCNILGKGMMGMMGMMGIRVGCCCRLSLGLLNWVCRLARFSRVLGKMCVRLGSFRVGADWFL